MLYVSEDIIWRCWRKTDILPETLDADTHNNVGSASLPEKLKDINSKLFDDLCVLIKEVKFKSDVTGVDIIGSEKLFGHSFVNDSSLSSEDYQEISNVWINIEDD